MQIREEMIHFGLDANTVKGRERLAIANYDDVYIVNGAVDIPGIIGRFAKMVDSYKALGLNGLRAAAEMSCFFQKSRVEELIAYEVALHRKLSFAAKGICAYNILEMGRSGSLDLVMNLVRAHDPVIFGSPNGYLFVKPEKVEKKHVGMVMQVPIQN